MCIVTLLQELASTTHHKINLDKLLKEKNADIQQVFANNDASYLKALFNETEILADRTTIFDL
ncbi:hypothetical protein [Legionella longbeachae]|uniref:Uncharacterized protein n=1 Tax=Legionella longbeachae serogroup 1 (strain NSW150) TaxID=661367 RepID=D3HMW8_LEGLN|nr:hypothetical protein [Legionella longbeachae]VEE04335.1 Uncharacterised protein [Legionella oakridgensis]ARB92843.1 hypothetical protein A6J40_11940 [Legionella longbeachae]QEY53058.1 hypothetical protein FQU71_18515 [Legionella longbeachae]QIN37232.1 hypothetical protein GCS73_17160 [Legionella longbeachae]RZV26493.1 hypothetical protein EKG34_04960 [Legionella longbeachae]